MGRVVVFIDDDAFLTRVVGMSLRARGFEVHTADNAVDGRRLVSEQSPDVIVIDVIMPGEDGITAVRKMREAGVTAPIVVFTGLEDEETAKTAMDAGATELMNKPFELETFQSLVNGLLETA